MAGIGFDLKKLFAEKQGVSKANVAIKSVIVSTGPWLISIGTLATLLIFLEPNMREDEFYTLSGSIIYTFIFSMIISSPISNAATRHLSDRLYMEDFQSVSSIFLSSVAVCAFISFVLSFSYVYFVVSQSFYALEVAFFFVLMSVVWVAMVFVGALKDYNAVVNSFAVGMTMGVFLVVVFGGYELHKSLACFSAGVAITFFWLSAKIYAEFGFDGKISFGWLKSANSRVLMATGLFFYSGMWIDKLMYWGSDKALSSATGFWFFPSYDFAIFLAYLTTMPTVAYFTVFVETVFYEAQREYLDGVTSGADLWIIKSLEQKMQKAFFKALAMTALFQVFTTVTFVLFTTFILDYYNINLLSVPLLRICAICATMHILIQVIVIFLYYFDFQKESLFVSFCMLFSNFVFALIFVDLPFQYTGYGYALALLLTLIIALAVGSYKFKRLSYYTFTSSSM